MTKRTEYIGTIIIFFFLVISGIGVYAVLPFLVLLIVVQYLRQAKQNQRH